MYKKTALIVHASFIQWSLNVILSRCYIVVNNLTCSTQLDAEHEHDEGLLIC